ncbi:hypothetical protein Tco_0754219 [Tanacetum coccineum]
MEAHLAPKQSVQVNKISSSCEICSDPHDTQYCMENPEQAFVDYVSSHTDEAGVIMKYLVKVSKRRAFWSLNEDILKITILTTNTPYLSRKIRHIRACTHQRPQRKEDQ